MLRRLFKTGNSIVLSLPKEALITLGIGEGESVSLEIDSHRRCIIISPTEKSLTAAGVDEKFARHVNEFIERYRVALDELAK